MHVIAIDPRQRSDAMPLGIHFEEGHEESGFFWALRSGDRGASTWRDNWSKVKGMSGTVAGNCNSACTSK